MEYKCDPNEEVFPSEESPFSVWINRVNVEGKALFNLQLLIDKVKVRQYSLDPQSQNVPFSVILWKDIISRCDSLTPSSLPRLGGQPTNYTTIFFSNVEHGEYGHWTEQQTRKGYEQITDGK